MNPERANHPRNYRLDRLRGAGPRGRIALSASYDDATRTVTLTLSSPVPMTTTLRLVAIGTGRRGLSDPRGRLLDGNADGRPGGNFVDRLSPRRPGRQPAGRGAAVVRARRAAAPQHVHPAAVDLLLRSGDLAKASFVAGRRARGTRAAAAEGTLSGPPPPPRGSGST